MVIVVHDLDCTTKCGTNLSKQCSRERRPGNFAMMKIIPFPCLCEHPARIQTNPHSEISQIKFVRIHHEFVCFWVFISIIQ